MTTAFDKWLTEGPGRFDFDEWAESDIAAAHYDDYCQDDPWMLDTGRMLGYEEWLATDDAIRLYNEATAEMDYPTQPEEDRLRMEALANEE